MIVGRWTIEAQFNRIRCGDHVVALEPKVMELLLFLHAQRGRVVPRDELLEAVWANVHVVPGVVGRAIYQLRKALQSDGQVFAQLITVPKRGYCLSETPLRPRTREGGNGASLWAAGVAGALMIGAIVVGRAPISDHRSIEPIGGFSLPIPAWQSRQSSPTLASSRARRPPRPASSATGDSSAASHGGPSAVDKVTPTPVVAIDGANRQTVARIIESSTQALWPTDSRGVALPMPPATPARPAKPLRPPPPPAPPRAPLPDPPVLGTYAGLYSQPGSGAAVGPLRRPS